MDTYVLLFKGVLNFYYIIISNFNPREVDEGLWDVTPVSLT